MRFEITLAAKTEGRGSRDCYSIVLYYIVLNIILLGTNWHFCKSCLIVISTIVGQWNVSISTGEL
jgi:hypothetical protein